MNNGDGSYIFNRFSRDEMLVEMLEAFFMKNLDQILRFIRSIVDSSFCKADEVPVTTKFTLSVKILVENCAGGRQITFDEENII